MNFYFFSPKFTVPMLTGAESRRRRFRGNVLCRWAVVDFTAGEVAWLGALGGVSVFGSLGVLAARSGARRASQRSPF